MSVSEVTSRIAQIQSQLAQLAPRTAGSGASARTSFSSALDGASQASGTSSTAGSALLDGAADASTLAGLGIDTSGLGEQGSTSGADVVAEARKYLGIPYVWGGTDPQKGLDCSGLVQLVYKNLGVDLPRVSRDQAREGTAVPSLDQAQPGDLLAFGSPVHHIAIYAGNGQMIEAPRPGLDVRVSDVYETPSAIRRVLDPSAAAPTSALLGAGGLGAPSGTAAVAGVPYADLFNQAGLEHQVDARLLAAVARQESGFDPSAVSPAGAQGMMQLMPGTAAGLGVTDSFDPAQAVDGAAKLLSQLLDRFGSTPLALAAYNAGPGAVMRYDGVPPYPETQNYVRSVMGMLGSS
ncbi:transglycosylase SLT domain-containing protein [Nocardioides anomalus]|uniref:Transglycosylase SLT domain-containing protein n=1 Tax=Nocardioides anomalus TaxID=2712223 RepID=A0A6G6WBD7_9ACTN|nr:transglycosylase SLT domain-containing protein [Nocardioides anomalus]QIG42463.1 transglycosylase SLT domain-containing protein [Nocardioides anomalus]